MAAGMGLGVMNAGATSASLVCPATVWPAPDYTTVAASVRDLFRFLGLDAHNPLGRWIQPGMTVVIKPSWVKHEFGATEGCHVLYTHASLVGVLLDAALAAVGRNGRVFVADAPLQGCHFARFRRQSGLVELEERYARAPVAFLDLRQQWAQIDDASSFVRGVHALAGDPQGYSLVDLAAHSRLACFGVNARFGVTDYRAETTSGHHRASQHRYLVSNTVLSADVILNVPKLKTHMKSGMTGALKNFVGIVGSKDFLPHFRAGSPRSGGDEYPDRNWASRAASPVRGLLQTRAPLWLWKLARAGAQATSSPVIHGGGWHGNDTLWRTVHDLVDVARNYGVDGARRERPRAILTLVDAIVAGEDCGPLKPLPKPCGLLVWGEDPGVVDVTCATLMGFDWRRIPLLNHLCDAQARAFSDFAGEPVFHAPAPGLEDFVRTGAGQFAPPVGWVGEIEAAPKQ
ncbi:MAG TPA: DUF362 domain-containing protein [Bryobacteraceae bacterium]|nr:DUF362 domain-containing protein [Bryobacteraceae bacterium]